jgi:dolichol-phosphate mannosyltransferase
MMGLSDKDQVEESSVVLDSLHPAELESGLPSKDQVTVVLPTLNEEDGIGKVIDGLRREGYNSILVVDGYSTDDTVKIAKGKGVEVVFQCGGGKAGAVKTAIDYVKTPYMLVMDADYTYDPKDIKRMLAYISGYDEVIGLRENRSNIPLLHRIGNRLISTVLSLLMGQRISDPCSGMYMLKTESAKDLELTSKSFDVEVEIAAQFSSVGKVTEVPIDYKKRVGKSKLQSWRAGFSILATVFKIAWLYNPVFLLSAIAGFFTVPGVIILLWQLYLRYIFGAERWSLGWSWLGLVFLIIGVQGFTISTVSLLLKRMERRIIQATRRNR